MTNPAQNATFAARQQEREDQMHAAFLMEAIAELTQQYNEIQAIQKAAFGRDDWSACFLAVTAAGRISDQRLDLECALSDLGYS